MRVWISKSMLAAVLGPCLAATAMAAASPPEIDNAALANESDGANWAGYGRSFSEQHYSPLRQINASNAKLPASAPAAPAVPLDDPQFKIDSPLAEKGKNLFLEKLCSMCHGFGAIAGGGAPDLRASPLVLSPEAFTEVVQGGILQAKGMPRYAELSDADLRSLRHYLRARARESSAAANKPQ